MTDSTPQDGTPVNNGQVPGAPVNPTPPSGSGTPAEETWWKEASEKHGFKTKEDVYKSWSEANQKISEQGEKLKNFQIFQDNVVPVLDVVLGDEEILGKVKGKMDPNAVKPASAPLNNTPTEDPDTKKYLIDDVVHSFETKYGIDKLDAETQKDIKAKIGAELKQFTTVVGPDGKERQEIKVSSLAKQLEKSFLLVTGQDEKLKSVFTPKDDTLGDYGSMPSQSSGLDKDGNIKLSPEQEKAAERMPGGREAYIRGLKKIKGVK